VKDGLIRLTIPMVVALRNARIRFPGRPIGIRVTAGGTVYVMVGAA